MKIIKVWEKRGWKYRAKIYSDTPDNQHTSKWDFCERALLHNCKHVDASLIEGFYSDGDYELGIKHDDYPLNDVLQQLIDIGAITGFVIDVDSKNIHSTTNVITTLPTVKKPPLGRKPVTKQSGKQKGRNQDQIMMW